MYEMQYSNKVYLSKHDGRGKSNGRHHSKRFDSERDIFLNDINLDNILSKIANRREKHDFAHNRDSSEAYSSIGRSSRSINSSTERQKRLSECHVICTTLSGAGSKSFTEAVSRDAFPLSEFDAVIIDEACQGSEMASLIPLKFNPNVLILVGDPKQLPVMTFSQDAQRCRTDRSLFERLYESGWPIHLLRYQYRMHEEIASFPSRTFYDNMLITSKCVLNREKQSWYSHYAFPPYLFWNVNGAMTRGPNGGITNDYEAVFTCRLLNDFRLAMPNVREVSIGIITFYNDQASLIDRKLEQNQVLKKWMRKGNITLQVSTVDGFQGSEKDIIILSCVRSKLSGKSFNNKIGFLKDFRRVNVALTRAKHSLWILGDANILSSDGLWSNLINDARSRNLIAHQCDLDQFMERKETPTKIKKKKKKRNRQRHKNINRIVHANNSI